MWKSLKENLSKVTEFAINVHILRIPDSYGAKTTENQTPLSHFA